MPSTIIPKPIWANAIGRFFIRLLALDLTTGIEPVIIVHTERIIPMVVKGDS
jgi:hypothetical protein